MGVDQTARGLEVSVAEWSDAGARTALFDGTLGAQPLDGATLALLSFAALYAVDRALIDPHPDQALAARVVGTHPEIFALQAGSQHNAASLAEVAWRRAQSSAAVPEVTLSRTHLVAMEPDLLDPSQVTVRVYVPAGEPVPTHLLVDLVSGDVMTRPDGSQIIERTLPLHEVSLPVAGPPMPGRLRQIWSLAPTTTLPARGWSLVLSLYANAALVHEQVVTQHQMMGLGNLADELARDAGDWLDRTPSLPAGPYTAEWKVYAGPTLIHTETSSSFAQPPLLMGGLHDKAVLSKDWIFDNAVAMEQQHPGINLPPEDPFDLSAFEADTFDSAH